MDNIWEKRKVIASAMKDKFQGKIPEDKNEWPLWYKKRMEICEKCPKNTKNMEDDKIDNVFLWAVKKLGKVTGKKQANCSYCGCFVDLKCWTPTEVCGRAEAGLEPYWGAINVAANDGQAVDVEVLTEGVEIGLNPDAGGFMLTFGDVEFGSNKEIRFNLVSDEPIHVAGKGSSCGCTTLDYTMSEDNKTIKAVVNINTSAAAPNGGEFSKNAHFMICNYEDKDLDFEDNKNIEKRKFVFFKLRGRCRFSSQKEYEMAEKYVKSLEAGVEYNGREDVMKQFAGLTSTELKEIYNKYK